MITNFKKFESFEDEPQVGDYVTIENDSFDESITDFLKYRIGKIIKITTDGNLQYPYTIQFTYNIPIYNRKTIEVDRDEIKEFAPTREMLKMKKTTDKYNL